MTLWQGTYRDMEATWLRWQDEQGNLLLTGKEWAESAEERAVQAEERVERLAAQLRALGVTPEE